MPQNEEDWLRIAGDFNQKWNFPHCLGAMDGKHIVIEAPKNSGTEYYNYKGTFSIILFALVDANYLFTFVDIGCQGRISDGGVFRNTILFKKLENKELDLPTEKPLPFQEDSTPYVFVADDAFALSSNIMKPFPGVHEKGSVARIFNYRLSRARRIVENVFGIMAAVFRVFRKPMPLEPEKASLITMTCVLLHNFLRKSRISSSSYTPPGTFDSEQYGELIPGSWRNQENTAYFMLLKKQPRKASSTAKEVREKFAAYFQSNHGRLDWQNDK